MSHFPGENEETIDLTSLDSENGESENVESENVESENVGSENVESENGESENGESENVNTENVESENAILENEETVIVETENQGSENVESVIVSENEGSVIVISDNEESEIVVSENVDTDSVNSENVEAINMAEEWINLDMAWRNVESRNEESRYEESRYEESGNEESSNAESGNAESGNEESSNAESRNAESRNLESRSVLSFSPRIDVDFDAELENVPATSGLKAVDPNSIAGLERLHCIVCKLLPYTALCQCNNMHTICAGCFQMLVPDKPPGLPLSICPMCKTNLIPHENNRDYLGERLLAEIVVECDKCGDHLPRENLRHHERRVCSKRLVYCKYKRVGCNWKGVVNNDHEKCCEFIGMKGLDLLNILRQMEEQREATTKVIAQIMHLMQLPCIGARLIHLLPQVYKNRPEDIVVSPTFQINEMNWYLRFSTSVPSQTESSYLYYQLCLCLQIPEIGFNPITLSYTVVSGTHSEVLFQPSFGEKCEYSSANTKGPKHVLYQNTWDNILKLINERGIYARFIFAEM